MPARRFSDFPETTPEMPLMSPMLAEGGHLPFDDPQWRFEPKLDGVRTLAYLRRSSVLLRSRTGRDQSRQYPELSGLGEGVESSAVILDGEIVAMDEDGRPSFELLQQRMNLTNPHQIKRMHEIVPVTLFLFDLLWLDGSDLTKQPLEKRRETLERVAGSPSSARRLTYFVEGEGIAFYQAACDLGFEGVVAKRLGSLYHPGRRSKEWRKIRSVARMDCVVIGWTTGTGSRAKTFGSLLLGAYKSGELVWVGRVGTGLSDALLGRLMVQLAELETSAPAVEDPELLAIRGARWVRPEMVCEVEFLQMTRAGRLRAPVFRRLRDDKRPQECTLPAD